MTENPSCFNAVLRRLLCSGNVPTHPSLDSTPDHSKPHRTDTCPNHDDKPKLQPLLPSSLSPSLSIKPGIVARLMGLESLPDSNWVRNPDSSFNRSKSVSFADYLMEFDDRVVSAPASLHRRVKTSVSFREAPAVLSHHNQNVGQEFLVLYLDENVKKKTGEVKQGKKKEEEFKKKEEKVVKKNESGAQSSRVKKVVMSKKGGANLREGSGEHTPLKKTNKKVDVEPKLNKKKHQNEAKRREAAENSSPVSVFDIDDIFVQHETWLSEYNSSPKDLKSVMKSPPRASYNEDPEMRAIKFKDMEPVNKTQESEDHNELLAGKILKLTEEELRETKWVSNNEVKIEMLEEIYVEVEAVILEVLLNQVVDDLVQLS